MLVLLGAVIWLYVIASWKPQWFKQTTARLALWSSVEGALCAVLWALGKPLVEHALGFSGLLDAAVAGVAWGGMSFYGKTRFRADLYYTEKKRFEQIFRR